MPLMTDRIYLDFAATTPLLPEAAEAMKLVAPDLLKLGLIDDVIDEPTGGAHHDHQASADAFRDKVLAQLEQLVKLPVPELLEARYAKFRKFGEWQGKA